MLGRLFPKEAWHFMHVAGSRKSHQPPAIRIRVAKLTLQTQRQMSLVTIGEAVARAREAARVCHGHLY